MAFSFCVEMLHLKIRPRKTEPLRLRKPLAAPPDPTPAGEAR